MDRPGDVASVGKNLVHNLQRKNTSDEAIFHELRPAHFPQGGRPLAICTTKDQANGVAFFAHSAFANKRRCIETERAAQFLQTMASLD